MHGTSTNSNDASHPQSRPPSDLGSMGDDSTSCHQSPIQQPALVGTGPILGYVDLVTHLRPDLVGPTHVQGPQPLLLRVQSCT